MDTLAELCSILHGCIDAEQDQDARNAVQLSLFKILQDTQARFVFRAQNYLRNEIQMFKPSVADLDYPKRLDGKCQASKPVEVSYRIEMTATSVDTSSPYGKWYPTLERTLYILSKLYVSIQVL